MAMLRKFLILVFLFTTPFLMGQGHKITRHAYLELYKDLAVKEMKRSGIPASITIAQGMLESDNGNSTLALKANNHFGIKCHNWKGKFIRHDDDKRNECFRKYKNPEESYIDHSDFLMYTPRYAFLFEYAPTDYVSWAKGLKKAGYATSPHYADVLIKIIEDNKLYLLDQGVPVVPGYGRKKTEKIARSPAPEVFYVSVNTRDIHERNRVEYIMVKDGDSYESLTEELELLPWELARYNDIEKGDELIPGTVLYIQPKRNRAEHGNDIHVVKDGETMHYISQLYGIKLKNLYRKNSMETGEEPQAGQNIYLRKKKKS